MNWIQNVSTTLWFSFQFAETQGAVQRNNILTCSVQSEEYLSSKWDLCLHYICKKTTSKLSRSNQLTRFCGWVLGLLVWGAPRSLCNQDSLIKLNNATESNYSPRVKEMSWPVEIPLLLSWSSLNASREIRTRSCSLARLYCDQFQCSRARRPQSMSSWDKYL